MATQLSGLVQEASDYEFFATLVDEAGVAIDPALVSALTATLRDELTQTVLVVRSRCAEHQRRHADRGGVAELHAPPDADRHGQPQRQGLSAPRADAARHAQRRQAASSGVYVSD